MIESFLNKGQDGNKPSLGDSAVTLKNVIKNALLCPEADLRTDLYNSYFNSSKYELVKSRFQPIDDYFKKSKGNDSHYYLDNLRSENVNGKPIETSLLLVEPEIELIKNNNYNFSSKAGDAMTPYLCVDVKYGDYNDPTNNLIKDNSMFDYNTSTSKVRGVFNTYIGTDSKNIDSANYYNIYQKGFNFEKH